jgi:hypothetical protein
VNQLNWFNISKIAFVAVSPLASVRLSFIKKKASVRLSEFNNSTKLLMGTTGLPLQLFGWVVQGHYVRRGGSQKAGTSGWRCPHGV